MTATGTKNAASSGALVEFDRVEVHLTMPDTPPVISIASPADAATVTTSTVTISGSYTANGSTVTSSTYQVDGGPAQNFAISSDAFSFSVASLSNGSHTVTTSVYYSGGTGAPGPVTASRTFTVDVPPAPSVAISSPAEGSTVTGSSVTVTGAYTANGSTVTNATYQIDGGLAQSFSISNGAFSFPVDGLSGGSHTVSVSVSYSGGTGAPGPLTASRTFTVSLPSQAPTLLLLSPSEGGTWTNGSVLIYGLWMPNGSTITSSTYIIDSGAEQAFQVKTDGSFAIDVTGLSSGTHTVAVAIHYTDASGKNGWKYAIRGFVVRTPGQPISYFYN